MENLARYIIRTSFSQERMQYVDQEEKVTYASRDGKSIKVSQAMEWLAAMCFRVPTGVSRWCGTKDYVTLSET